MDVRFLLPDGTMLTDVCMENTDVRKVGFHPPISDEEKSFITLDPGGGKLVLILPKSGVGFRASSTRRKSETSGVSAI